MKPPIIITPAAELDIADAIDWYGAISPELPLVFRLVLDTTLGLVAEFPDSYALVARGLRRALLRRFPHGVFYRHEASVIQVVAVLPTTREPRVWQARSH
jgi:plasmid stabilization system protein ParE